MATAIAKQRSGGGLIESSDEGTVLEEATLALCAVLTNAVEVYDDEGRALGIAVFEHAFSWINHSCSPNACYRFSFDSSLISQESKLRIAPFTHDSEQPKVNFIFSVSCFIPFLLMLFDKIVRIVFCR